MNMKLPRKLGAAAAIAALLAPLGANAESTFATGTGAFSTSASVDFRITIPKFLSLRVGSTGTTVNVIDFAPTAAAIGTSTSVAGTGGDLGAGAVTASVVGNGGTVSLVGATTGALSNGTGGLIDWSEITSLSGNPALAAPVLVTGATSGVVSVAATAGVVNQTATWTYSYDNTGVVAAGTYGGVNVNGGRVTYTASVL